MERGSEREGGKEGQGDRWKPGSKRPSAQRCAEGLGWAAAPGPYDAGRMGRWLRQGRLQPPTSTPRHRRFSHITLL